MATGPNTDDSASGPAYSGRLFPSFSAYAAGALLTCSNASLIPHIKRDREQQHQTLNGLLVVNSDTHERHAIIHDTHDQTTDDGAHDGTDTTSNCRATNECGSNGIELEHGSGLRVSQVQSRGEDHARQR